MVSSKADGRKNPIGLFVLFLAYGWSKIECEVRIFLSNNRSRHEVSHQVK